MAGVGGGGPGTLGPVDTDTVGPVLGERVTFVTDPSPDDLAVTEGVFAMAPRVTKGPRPLTDPESTLAAMESGRSSGVGPDVSHPEPARHHPLFDHPGCRSAPLI